MPNDPNPYDSYAELLMKMGKFDASIVQYQKALAIDNHFGGSYIGITADQMFAGRDHKAIAESQAYFAVARDDGERRTALLAEAVAHVGHGATDAALAAMDRRYRIATATGDTANMSADGIAIADILLAAGFLAERAPQVAFAHSQSVGERLDRAPVERVGGDLHGSFPGETGGADRPAIDPGRRNRHEEDAVERRVASISGVVPDRVRGISHAQLGSKRVAMYPGGRWRDTSQSAAEIRRQQSL